MNSEPLSKQYLDVDGKRMAFHERGEGDPIVFLHGNPTSSYLWRNVLPHVADKARCIAIDLIGMGDSDKVDNPGPDSYTFLDHRRYLEGLLEQLDLGDRVTFVVHDWGSALAFDWARRHPDRVAGFVYMEAMTHTADFNSWGEEAKAAFLAFRSDEGEDLILEKNIFVELVLPAGVVRDLTEEEMTEYRRPYIEPGEDRRPTLTWPRQQPNEGEPAEVVEIVERYAQWMCENDIPKLFVNGDPGWILTGPNRDFCRTWRAQTEVTVPGTHYLQEDSPDLIGQAISEWLDAVRKTAAEGVGSQGGVA